jgi:hypothetical protein
MVPLSGEQPSCGDFVWCGCGEVVAKIDSVLRARETVLEVKCGVAPLVEFDEEGGVNLPGAGCG